MGDDLGGGSAGSSADFDGAGGGSGGAVRWRRQWLWRLRWGPRGVGEEWGLWQWQWQWFFESGGGGNGGACSGSGVTRISGLVALAAAAATK